MTKLLPLLLETFAEALTAAIIFPAAYLVYHLIWRPHERQAHTAAQCDPEALSGVWDGKWTVYTARQIDEAYRLARLGKWIDEVERMVTK